MRPFLLVTVLAMSCAKTPAPADTTSTAPVTAQALAAREWRLVELEGRTDPTGAEGREVTLRFEEGTRVSGFSGCNRYTGSYTVRGDSITFGPAGVTRMACSQGMDTEQTYLSILPRVARFAIADSTLTLFSTDKPLARFR